MNKLELKEKLDVLGVKEKEYSLNGDLKPDAIILFINYDQYEVFYLDERGGRNNEHKFTNESDAYNYIFKFFTDERDFAKKFGLNL